MLSTLLFKKRFSLSIATAITAISTLAIWINQATADPPPAESNLITLDEIKNSVSNSPEIAAEKATLWARSLLNAWKNEEAVEAATLLLPLRQTPEYQMTLLDVKGWGLIRLCDPVNGVHSLLQAAQQGTGHPDAAAGWVLTMEERVFGAATGSAQIGKSDLASDLLTLCDMAILNAPEKTDRLQIIQMRRVQCLLALGKTRANDALCQAKAFYNVCSMEQTANAMFLMFQALELTDPSHELAQRFKQEQILGSQELPAFRAEEVDAVKPPVDTVLHQIHLDASSLSQGIEVRKASSFPSLTGRGNLLLLSDRPAEAYKTFESAYTCADQSQIAAATENLARALRAQDGTIARANAYVRCLRVDSPRLIPISSMARSQTVRWKYTFDMPGDRWQSSRFDDNSWKEGSAPFGAGQATDWTAPPRTEWKTTDIWMRRPFSLSESIDLASLRLVVEWDHESEVYVNGILAGTFPKSCRKYTSCELNDAALAAIKPGSENLLAVHCHNHGANQVIDVGIVSVRGK